MRYQQIAFLLLASPVVLAAAHKKLDWLTVEKISPGTHIFVTTRGGTECAFQKATEDRLCCTLNYPGSNYKGPNPNHEFNRSDIRDVCIGEIRYCSAFDASAGRPIFIGALEAGGGWSDGYMPISFAGAKIGLAGITLDLQYDRLKSKNGFSTEGSWMIPLFRLSPYKLEHDRLFVRGYAEPGLGYRAGGYPFGQYASAKALILFGPKWVDGGASPYLEFQRRFPFNSPLSGDNRIAIGIMWAVCEHCGIE